MMFVKQILKSKLNLIPYHLKSTKAYLPHTVFLAINNTCNLQCVMCDVGQKKTDTEFYKNMIPEKCLTVDEWNKVIDNISSFNPFVAITSVEPLLYPGILDVLSHIKEKNLEYSLTTNGYLLPKYADDLAQLNPSSICVSLDGYDTTHAVIRGNDKVYWNAIEGIKKLNEYKVPVHVNFTINHLNYDKIGKFVSHLLNCKIESITICHPNFISKDIVENQNEIPFVHPVKPSCEIPLEEINIALLEEEIYYTRNISPIKISVVPDISYRDMRIFYEHPTLFIKDHMNCKAPWLISQIFADGSVGISTRCFNLNFGDAVNEPFKDIWNGLEAQKFRGLLLRHERFPICARCCGVF